MPGATERVWVVRLDPRVAAFVIIAVVIAWLTLTIISALSPDVEVPPALNGLFLTLAGGAVAMGFQEKNRDGDSK